MRFKKRDSPSLGVGRRGPKGYFLGTRKEFLDSQLPEYLATKRGARQKFWYKFYCAWWQRFPWKLGDDEEPPTDNPEEMARLASVAPGDDERKRGVEESLTTVCWTASPLRIKSDRVAFQRLKGWFTNHAASTNARHDTNTWFDLIQQFHQLRNPRPRCRSIAQQFMVDHPGVLNASFVSLHGDGRTFSNPQRLNLRLDLARKMVSGHYAHLAKDLEKAAATHHEKEMKEWKVALENLSEAEDVSVCVLPSLICGCCPLTLLFQCSRYTL